MLGVYLLVAASILCIEKVCVVTGVVLMCCCECSVDTYLGLAALLVCLNRDMLLEC